MAKQKNQNKSTGALAGNFTTTSTGSYNTAIGQNVFIGYSSTSFKKKFHILGEDCEFEMTYEPSNLVQNICILNVLGWVYYEELQKNNYTFGDNQIREYLENRYKVYLRDNRINTILETKE